MIQKKVALIGGTGPEGLGLTARFAGAGLTVLIGSRQEAKAEEAAAKIKGLLPDARVSGCANLDAAAQAEVVLLALPYEGQAETLVALRRALAGKTLITTVVPMRFERGAPNVVPVPEGSAAEQAARLVPEARVAAAFHHLSAPKLLDLAQDIPADVIVCGDDPAAKAEAIALAGLIKGCRGLDGGGLNNARHVEALTAVLVTMNRIYKTRSAVKIVGV